MKNKGLSDKLRELRLAHSYKQVDVASAIGVIRQTYSHYERGDRTPNPEVLYKIAAFYNISVNELMQYAIPLDPEIYYDAPPLIGSVSDLDAYISYLNEPLNQKRFKHFSNEERELIFYFNQMESSDKWTLIELAKILARKKVKNPM